MPANEGKAASVIFAPNETGVWKQTEVVGLDDTGIDDGNIAYTLRIDTVSPDEDWNFHWGTIGSFTNLDDDLKANGSSGWVVDEVEEGDPTGHRLMIAQNDQDLGGDDSWEIVDASVAWGQGSIIGGALDENGKLRGVKFLPVADWYGGVGIYYKIGNEWDKTSSKVSSGTVTNVPDKPVAVQDNPATATEGAFVNIQNVVGNDSDKDDLWPPPSTGLTIASVTAIGGTATTIQGGSGIQFTPTPGKNSNDPQNVFSVTYTVKDPQGNVSDNSITIPITVNPINVKPKAMGALDQNGNPVVLNIDEDGSAVAFATTDVDEDEEVTQVLAYAIVTDPLHGLAVADGSGGWLYTPNDPDYSGSDFMQYTVTDNAAAGPVEGLISDPVTVAFNINPVNDADRLCQQRDDQRRRSHAGGRHAHGRGWGCAAGWGPAADVRDYGLSGTW